LPFTLEADPRGTTFLVNLADDRVATVTADGEVAIVDAARSSAGFVTRHGDVVYAARTAAGAELRIALDGEDPRAVAPVVALYAGLYNRAGYFRSRTASPDGRAALFATTFDPATGLTDMHLLDTRTGDTAVLTTETTATIGSELFTADADHALYFTDVDLNAGTGRLVAATPTGSADQPRRQRLRRPAAAPAARVLHEQPELRPASQLPSVDGGSARRRRRSSRTRAALGRDPGQPVLSCRRAIVADSCSPASSRPTVPACTWPAASRSAASDAERPLRRRGPRARACPAVPTVGTSAAMMRIGTCAAVVVRAGRARGLWWFGGRARRCGGGGRGGSGCGDRWGGDRCGRRSMRAAIDVGRPMRRWMPRRSTQRRSTRP
jgi:hypothetical protein